MKQKLVRNDDPRAQRVLAIAEAMQNGIPLDAATVDVYSAITLMIAHRMVGEPPEIVRKFCDTFHQGILMTLKNWKETSN